MERILEDHLILTALVMVLVALILIPVIVGLVHRLVPETQGRAPMSSGFVNILVSVIFAVSLNGLFSLKRDRDSRDWSMRQQHLTQLRPVLKQESDQLSGLADNFHQRGFVEGEHGAIRKSPAEFEPFLEPNVMSFDLANHYQEYVSSKRNLEAALVNHDRNVLLAASEAAKGIGIRDISWFSAERLGLTYVWACMGRGQGFTLTVHPGGFSASYYGASVGGSGTAGLQELEYGYRHYRAFKPSQSLQDSCSSLKASADAVETQAHELSKMALLLGQETTLRGSCPFVKPD